MLVKKIPIPGLFVTATDTGVGKTIIASAIARTLHQRGKRVAVLKPAASGCYHSREAWVSEDAEMLAAASDTHHPLDLICPNRFEEPLAPAVAARRARGEMDYAAIDRSVQIMSRDADCFVVEGVGGVLVPMDDRYVLRDLIVAFGVPAIIVARAGLGTINHTLLTIESLRSVGVEVLGVVINQYPADNASVAEETNPREIERISRVPILCIASQEPFTPPHIGPGVMAAVGQVDWESKMSAGNMPRP